MSVKKRQIECMNISNSLALAQVLEKLSGSNIKSCFIRQGFEAQTWQVRTVCCNILVNK